MIYMHGQNVEICEHKETTLLCNLSHPLFAVLHLMLVCLIAVPPVFLILVFKELLKKIVIAFQHFCWLLHNFHLMK